jgi:hypothetical protein
MMFKNTTTLPQILCTLPSLPEETEETRNISQQADRTTSNCTSNTRSKGNASEGVVGN